MSMVQYIRKYDTKRVAIIVACRKQNTSKPNTLLKALSRQCIVRSIEDRVSLSTFAWFSTKAIIWQMTVLAISKKWSRNPKLLVLIPPVSTFVLSVVTQVPSRSAIKIRFFLKANKAMRMESNRFNGQCNFLNIGI